MKDPVTSDSCNHDMRPAPPTRDGEAWRQCSKCGYSAPVETVTSKPMGDHVNLIRAQLSFGHPFMQMTREMARDIADVIERLTREREAYFALLVAEGILIPDVPPAPETPEQQPVAWRTRTGLGDWYFAAQKPHPAHASNWEPLYVRAELKANEGQS